MPDNNFEPINWDFLLDKVEEENCVVILGPEVLEPLEGIPVAEALCRHLGLPHNEKILRYYAGEEFFLFREPQDRTMICYEIKKFYRDALPVSPLLQKIAQIPFSVYLTVSPDKTLNRAFELLNLSCQAGFYKKNKEPGEIHPPTRKLPLLYNVFGSIESEESLILTHDDLYDYFKSIFARRSMPELLKGKLLQAKNFIFLGVPFDKWYMQLLLRELEIHKQHDFTRFAANQTLAEEVRTLCLEQFRIQFIPHRISEFIDHLWEKAKARGLLREQSKGFETALDGVRESVKSGELEKAIDQLEQLTEGTGLEDAVSLLSGRYSRFRKRELSGILTADQKSVTEAELMEGMVQLISEAAKILAKP